jgi:hypothetical protein
VNRADLQAKAEAAREAIAAHARLNEDDRAEGQTYDRKDAALAAFHEAATPDAVLALLTPNVDPTALRAVAERVIAAHEADQFDRWEGVDEGYLYLGYEDDEVCEFVAVIDEPFTDFVALARGYVSALDRLAGLEAALREAREYIEGCRQHRDGSRTVNLTWAKGTA